MTEKLLTVRRVAELIGGTVEGDDSGRIESVSALDSAGPADVTFATDEKRLARVGECRGGALIVPKSAELPHPSPVPLIRVEDVRSAVALLLGHLSPPPDLPPLGVDPTARISPDAQVGEGVRIGPGVVVASAAKIGRGSTLCANVSIGLNADLGEDVLLYEGVSVRRDCILGNRVIVGPNSVIGYDGFGYYQDAGVHHRIPHIGNVVIEDDVEIGACSCVDRAKFGTTRIGAGTKIDNLVQIAHNVQIGRGCMLAAQCGIAGSAKLGDYVVFGGNVGIRDNITIGDRVTCAAYTAVANDVPDGQTLFGIPAIPAREKFRQISLTNKLPQLVQRVRALEERLKGVESAEDH